MSTQAFGTLLVSTVFQILNEESESVAEELIEEGLSYVTRLTYTDSILYMAPEPFTFPSDMAVSSQLVSHFVFFRLAVWS